MPLGGLSVDPLAFAGRVAASAAVKRHLAPSKMEAEVRPLLPPRAPARPPAAQSKHAHPYLPILDWLPGYPWAQHLPADVAGGVTLGCILMAQSLAHASLCGVALIHGPYSCMLPPVVYALFGTCIHSSVGTGGLVSLLVGVRLAEYGDLAHRTRAAAVLTLEVGLALALMGALQLGWLVRFLSRPALSGFMTASALMIMGSQLPPMLGLPSGAGLGPRALARAHWPTVALSGVAYAWLVCAQQFKSRPGLAFLSHFKELLLLIAAGAFCSVWDVGVAVVGQVHSSASSTRSLGAVPGLTQRGTHVGGACAQRPAPAQLPSLGVTSAKANLKTTQKSCRGRRVCCLQMSPFRDPLAGFMEDQGDMVTAKDAADCTIGMGVAVCSFVLFVGSRWPVRVGLCVVRCLWGWFSLPSPRSGAPCARNPPGHGCG